MHILHVIASSRGGGAVHVRALARAQVLRGHLVSVAMAQEGELVPSDLLGDGVRVLDVGPAGPMWVARLGRVFFHERPEVVHLHGSRAALWARLAIIPLFFRPVVLYALHGFNAPYLPLVSRQARRLGEAALRSVTDGYVCVCSWERDQAARFGLPPGRLHVIHNGVDQARFAENRQIARQMARKALGEAEDAWILFTAGRLDRPRDPGLVLRAMALSAPRDPTVRLLVAGDGPQRAASVAAARELGLGDRVRHLGYREDLPELLAAADALVHVTSAWEGLPYAVLEAMASGLPVVATGAGGTPEAVVNGETGYLVPVGDEVALAAALGRLRADPMQARQMGDKGRARQRAFFTESRMVAAHEALYSTARQDLRLP